MNRTILTVLTVMLILASINCSSGQELNLPQPNRTGGKPLMEALDQRASFRAYSDRELSLQQLSDLLWAAWGYNRTGQEKRTAPSSRNNQEIDIYVSLGSGLYWYDALEHSLRQIHNRDIRALTGTQDFPATAPVNLIYVADMAKRGIEEGGTIGDSDLLAPWANSGFIAQNVYLYCASEGLASVVRGLVDREKLAPEMQLRSNQVIIMAHTVGFPQQ